MGLKRAVFDSNILIDYFNENLLAAQEFLRYDRLAISLMTWMEILAGGPPELEARTRSFLKDFEILPITPAVAELAVKIRREQRLKLPDAVILATALVGRRILVTRNTRDFPAEEGLIRVPYTL